MAQRCEPLVGDGLHTIKHGDSYVLRFKIALERESLWKVAGRRHDTIPALAIEALRLHMRGHKNFIIRKHKINPAVIKVGEGLGIPRYKSEFDSRCRRQYLSAQQRTQDRTNIVRACDSKTRPFAGRIEGRAPKQTIEFWKNAIELRVQSHTCWRQLVAAWPSNQKIIAKQSLQPL